MMDEYIPSSHKPYSQTLKQVYADACKDLMSPPPAIRLARFPTLMEWTGGFREKEFSILCGSTGAGKTTFIAQLSECMISQKIPHFVASVETGHTDFVRRVISIKAGQDWNTGEAISPQEVAKLHKRIGPQFNIDSMHLSLYENRFSVDTLMADIAYHVKHHGIKIAMIDNLNFFLEVTAVEQSVVEMDRVIHELIIFCKKVPVHVIMVMHPRKTDDGRVSSMFDIKGSSTAVQEAHNVFLFNRPSFEAIENDALTREHRELKIAKVRRMGKHIGRTLVFRCPDGVSYHEDKIIG